MEIRTRAADPADAPAMADILNAIIRIGGTTAHEVERSPEEIRAAYISCPGFVSCHVAMDGAGLVAGFQAVERMDLLPEDCGDVATFARPVPKLPGVGRALFRATCESARAAGLREINAVIRADNGPGLSYYAKMGFADYDVMRAVPLMDGTPVDRIVKRFALD